MFCLMSLVSSWLPGLSGQVATEVRYSFGAQLGRGVWRYVENPNSLNLGGVQSGIPVPGFLCFMLYPSQADFGIALPILRVRLCVFLVVLSPS